MTYTCCGDTTMFDYKRMHRAVYEKQLNEWT